jgi:deoxyribodipyrimidine photo-lyase
MGTSAAIVWFRNDLRTADHPALVAAAADGGPVIALYILDDSRQFSCGGAQKWFLHFALEALEQELAAIGVPLIRLRGPEAAVLAEVVKESGAGAVFWHRRYSPAEVETDRAIKLSLSEQGVVVRSFSGTLLREPWEQQTKSGTPFQVFTPFWKALRAAGPSREEVAFPTRSTAPAPRLANEPLSKWRLVPDAPDWAREFAEIWSPSSAGAISALRNFLDGPLSAYPVDRDRPALAGTSRLSPHLALGTISPLTIWNEVQAHLARNDSDAAPADKFHSEIAWREFSYHLLFHNPQMTAEPLKKAFAAFPWRTDDEAFSAWTSGRTGMPIIDAGMRELWRTGWMHNRVRMIVASFLVKNLLLPWRKGERWFWDTLVDADPANNCASWQWVAGSGADAAPYFRIFNPVTQGEKFDPDGDYVRRFVPELARLPDACIHAPWKAPDDVLTASGVTLGVSYPLPLVDLDQSRKRALASYQSMKSDAA